MIEKIKNFINNHYGYVPVLIIVALWIIIIPFVFLFQYKKPIKLSNEDDRLAITKMIEDQHGKCEVRNVVYVEDIIYPIYNDSISKLVKCESKNDHIAWYTDNVNYDIVRNDSLIESFTTIFEVEYKFLRKEVGKHLITFKK